MLRKNKTLVVNSGRPATAFFNRMQENFERKFDGFPARVNPALISPASEGVEFFTDLTSLTPDPNLPPGGVPICPDTGGDCIPPRGPMGPGTWLTGSSSMSPHRNNDQRNRDGDIFNNVHIESGQNIWRWYYDDTLIQDYPESPGSGGRCTFEWYYMDAYRYFFSGSAIQTEFGAQELAITQTYEYYPGPTTDLPEGATHWIVEFDWTASLIGNEEDRAAASAPGGFVGLTGDQNTPPQHVLLGTLIPHLEHYEVDEIGRVYAEIMIEEGSPQSGHAQITVPAKFTGELPPGMESRPAFHATVKFVEPILSKPNGTAQVSVDIANLEWRPNEEDEKRQPEGDVASDCLYRWSFGGVDLGSSGGWGQDWYSADPWSSGGYSRYASGDVAHATYFGSGQVSLVQSVITDYPENKDYIAQFAFHINADVQSIGVSRGTTSLRQFEWDRSEIAYLRTDSSLRQWNVPGVMKTEGGQNLLEFRMINGDRWAYLNGYGMLLPADDGLSGDFTVHVTLANQGHFELDYLTVMCRNTSNNADPECVGSTKTDSLAWSGELSAYIPSLIPSYYISVQIDGLLGVEGSDYTVCGNNICDIEEGHEVTAQYVIA